VLLKLGAHKFPVSFIALGCLDVVEKDRSCSSHNGPRSVYAYCIYMHIMGARKISGTGVTPVDWKAVGRRIRELRGFDMNQAEFARRIGISQSYLSTAERGKVEIGAEVLLAISRQCERSLEWLLTGDE
jgi:DNA-binding XRE family transcriptional regulator